MISVVIPTYNRSGFLEHAVRSVLEQTLPPAELLIIDDGSTDNTRELVAGLREESAVPILYHYRENGGAAAARNFGIRMSSEKFIAFLDSDDCWLPRKLEKQYEAMCSRPHYLISHTREIWYRNGKRVNQKKKHDPPHGDIFKSSLRMCMVGMSTVMVDRKCFERFGCFDEQLPCCEDYDLWLRMSCRIPFLRVDEALISKDGGRDDQLSAIHRMGMDVFRIRSLCNLLRSGRLERNQYQLTLEELERKCTIYGNGCLKHGREKEGNEYLALPNQFKHNNGTTA